MERGALPNIRYFGPHNANSPRRSGGGCWYAGSALSGLFPVL